MLEAKGFLSYSTKNKKLAGIIKESFKKIGINVFVAHDTIKPGKKWRAEIRQAIQDATWCFPLITGAFRGSEWTDQEVGMAIALGKEIFPLCAGKNKIHGFIADFQAIRFKSSNVEQLCADFVAAMSSSKSGVQFKKQLIERLYKSTSYDESRDLIKMLKMFRLSADERARVLEAAKKNNQIGGGGSGMYGWGYQEVREYLADLMAQI